MAESKVKEKEHEKEGVEDKKQSAKPQPREEAKKPKAKQETAEPEAAKKPEGSKKKPDAPDLKATPEEQERLDTEPDGPAIVVKKLKKSFGGKPILDGLDVVLEKKQNLVVMGKSGTGKSVLIKCIVQLIIPDSGIIEVFGQDTSKLNKRDLDKLRLRIGFLFQSGALYDSMTVRENMAFPLERQKNDMDKAERTARIEEVLDAVGLLHAIDKMPSELSGGMRKRAGLARTLILRPEIMLYDEPTTGLDTATSHEISELINSVRDKYHVSSIIITHDLPCAKTCGDSIMILKEGKNGAQGTYKELHDSDDEFVHSLFH